MTPDEIAVQQARAREGLDRDQELEDLRAILVDARVRDMLWRLMARAGMYRSPWSPNAKEEDRLIGMADMGRAILDEILEADPEAWIAMQQDALKRQRVAEAIAAQERENALRNDPL